MRVTRIAVGMFVLCCLGVPRTGRADDASAFEQGIARLDEQDFAAALRLLQQAYRETGDPNVLLYVGVAQQRLSRYQDAVRSFERFLDEGGAAVAADQRERALRAIAEIEAVAVKVTVHVEGAPAEVSIDGEPVGVSPLSRPVLLAPGRHRFAAARERGARLVEVEEIPDERAFTVVLAARPAPVVQARDAEAAPAPPAELSARVVPKPWWASRFEVGFGFYSALPRGEFRDQAGDFGYGISAYGGYRLQSLPVAFGVDLSAMTYGEERRTEPLSTTIPDVTVDVVTSNQMIDFHLLARVEPLRGTYQPYLEGLVGVKQMITKTEVSSEEPIDPGDDEPVFVSTNLSDTALSYGAGIGMRVRVYDGSPKPATLDEDGERHVPLDSFYIDLRARYMFGTTARYLTEGSIRRTNGVVEFDESRSRTDSTSVILSCVMRI